MKLILFSILVSGVLVNGVEVKEHVIEEEPTIKANATTKNGQWSSPDTTSATGFAASPIPASIYNLQEKRNTQANYATESPMAMKDQEGKGDAGNGDASTGASKMKSDVDSQKVANEYLKTLHQKKKTEMYNSQYKSENIKPIHNKVVFQNEYKPVKFESDFHATQFTHERTPYKSNNAPTVKEPYPYQYVNVYRDGPIVEPAPTASAQQSVSYNGHGAQTHYESGKKGSNGHGSHEYYESGKKGLTSSHKGGLKKKSAWDKVVRLLTAFIPLGLFLAALPPSLLNINSTVPQTIGRQRAEDGLHGIDLFQRFGFDSLNQEDCENRVFCEISRLGGQSSGNIVQQGFWQLAHETPDNMAEALGFKDIFKAVRNNDCGVFECPEKNHEKSREDENEGEEDDDVEEEAEANDENDF